MKTVLIITLSIVFSSISFAKTYTANTPAWRGEWIWAPRKSNVPVMTVNLRKWLEDRPGSWADALVNRILGNAVVCGVGTVWWRLDDGYGNALFPYNKTEKVLQWPNWGVDFNRFDSPAVAARVAKRCDMKIAFWTAVPEFYQAALKRYPGLNIKNAGPSSTSLIEGRQLKPGKVAKKWLDRGIYEFKKDFEISGKVSSARLCITADAFYQLFIDGKLIGSDGDWWRGETYDVVAMLTPRKHTVKATVKSSKEYSGLLINFEWRDAAGKLHQLDTGKDWLCRKQGTANWSKVSVVGFEGCGPRFRLKDVWRNPRVPNYLRRRLLIPVEPNQYTSGNSAVDGSLNTFWRGKGAGAQLVLNLKKPLTITEIRIFSGCMSNFGNPSGVCALKDYRLQVYEDGAWHDLVEPVKNAPDYRGEAAETFYTAHAFTPHKVQKIRLLIDRSHDTLKRNTGAIPAAQMTSIVREIELIKALGE